MRGALKCSPRRARAYGHGSRVPAAQEFVGRGGGGRRSCVQRDISEADRGLYSCPPPSFPPRPTNPLKRTEFPSPPSLDLHRNQRPRPNQPIIPYQRLPRSTDPALAIRRKWQLCAAGMSSVEGPLCFAVTDYEDAWGLVGGHIGVQKGKVGEREKREERVEADVGTT